MRVRSFEERDIPKLIEAWNRVLIHDRITGEYFERVVLQDANYQPESSFVAERSAGEISGFAHAVVRREAGDERGHLKVFFTTDEGGDASSDLLDQVERFCARAGKRELVVTEYSWPYFWPGVDLRYDRLREQLVQSGYRDVRTIEDVGVDLRSPVVVEAHERVCKSMPPGVSVEPWQPSLLAAMRTFAAEADAPRWFPAGFEERLLAERDHVFVLRNGHEILGWAKYSRMESPAFGPMLVLSRARGNHYGARLLVECMLRAREARASFMTAGWANTDFYTRYGWSITRRYAVLTKGLRAHP